MQDLLQIFERKAENELVAWDARFRKKHAEKVKDVPYTSTSDYYEKAERDRRLMALRSLIEDGMPTSKADQIALLDDICDEISEIQSAFYNNGMGDLRSPHNADLHWIRVAVGEYADKLRGGSRWR